MWSSISYLVRKCYFLGDSEVNQLNVSVPSSGFISFLGLAISFLGDVLILLALHSILCAGKLTPYSNFEPLSEDVTAS